MNTRTLKLLALQYKEALAAGRGPSATPLLQAIDALPESQPGTFEIHIATTLHLMPRTYVARTTLADGQLVACSAPTPEEAFEAVLNIWRRTQEKP